MPKLSVQNVGVFDVPQNKRLVLALTDEAGVDQVHACGGHAACTTCRVEFIKGEPNEMTEAEKTVLTERGLINAPALRLSCQIACTHDMEVRAVSRVSTTGRVKPGDRPADEIVPKPVWVER